MKQLVFGFTFRRAFTENAQRLNLTPPSQTHTNLLFSMQSPISKQCFEGPVPEQSGGTEPRLHMGFHSQALTATVQNSSCSKNKEMFYDTIIKQCKTEQPTTV